MFGIRADGRRVKQTDPFVQVTPYFMPMRCDAQVFLSHQIDYETLMRYIAAKSREDGVKITFMELMIAAFVRAVSQYPECNRFISNKQLFSRKELTVSLAMLRDTSDGSLEETTVKCFFDPTDTIFDVSTRMKRLIEENRKEESADGTLKVACLLMKVPFLPQVFMALARLLDRYGLLPRAVLNISPFHTSMFITNMASIGMHNVYHHIYNFGSTTLFFSLGTPERGYAMDAAGAVKRKYTLPTGITADERVAGGSTYALFFTEMKKYLAHPELLEQPPETVRYDPKCEYHCPKPEPLAPVKPAAEA